MAQTSSPLPVGIQGALPPRRFGLTGIQWRELRRFGTAMLFLAPSLFLFAVFVFIPLFRTISLSTYLTNPIGVPVVYRDIQLYQTILSSPAFLNSLSRSLLFVLYTVPTSIFLALGLALLGNLRLRAISLFRIFFSSTIAVSGATASLIFLYLFHPTVGSLNYFLGLLGIPAINWLVSDQSALPALAMTTVWLQLGLNTVVLLAAMQSIPEELYESAMIDGANSWNKFLHITLPFLSSTFFFLLVVDVLAAFQTFTPVHVMTSGGPMDSTNLLVYSIFREFYVNGKYGYAAAQSIVLFAIMLGLTIFQFTVLERKVYYE